MPRVKAGSIVVEPRYFQVDWLLQLINGYEGPRVGFLYRPGSIPVRIGMRILEVSVPPFSLVLEEYSGNLSQITSLGGRPYYVVSRDIWLDLKWFRREFILELLRALRRCLEGPCHEILEYGQLLRIELETIDGACEKIVSTGFYTAPYHSIVESIRQGYGKEPGIIALPAGSRLITVDRREVFYTIKLRIPLECRGFDGAFFTSLVDTVLSIPEY
ncbi:hypothetical protein ACSU1N_03030 [Thermogladius sp. 4427co]|uniref:hypothetical protein n=1 Tax=Thermogladius sp. 4427co TaxID=3450718 RepID=UPI003F7A6C83